MPLLGLRAGWNAPAPKCKLRADETHRLTRIYGILECATIMAETKKKYAISEVAFKHFLRKHPSLKSTDDVAKRIGISRRHFYRWLKALTWENLEDLATVLDCKPKYLLDPASAELDAFIFGFDDILRLEADLPASGGIAIVSGTGYLETEDDTLLKFMARRLQDGVAVTYFYTVTHPEILQASFPSDAVISSVRYIHEKLSPYDGKGRLRAYFFDNEVAQLVTSSSILAIFVDDIADPVPMHIFQYARCSNLLESGNADVWLKLAPGNDKCHYHDICTRLRKHSQPIPWLGLYDDSLRSDLQKDYRSLLTDATYAGLYARLRDHISTGKGNSSIFIDKTAALFRETGQGHLRRQETFQVLDVGIGDGEVSVQLLAALVKSLGIRETTAIRYHAVDPSKPDTLRALELYFRSPKGMPDLPEGWTRSLADLASHNIQFTLASEPFEAYSGVPTTFDVIFMIHSLYLIDLSYLRKALYLLKDDGILLIMIAPLRSNCLSQVCCAIDARLERICLQPQRRQKAIDDTFRNYGEDVKQFLNHSCDCDPELWSLPTELPTCEGCIDRTYIHDAARFFRGKLPLADSQLDELVNELMEEFQRNGSTAETIEHVFVVKKRELKDNFKLWREAKPRA